MVAIHMLDRLALDLLELRVNRRQEIVTGHFVRLSKTLIEGTTLHFQIPEGKITEINVQLRFGMAREIALPDQDTVPVRNRVRTTKDRNARMRQWITPPGLTKQDRGARVPLKGTEMARKP